MSYTTLINRQTGEPELVQNEDLPAAQSSGKYLPLDGVAADVGGTSTYVPPSQVSAPGSVIGSQNIDPTVMATQRGQRQIEEDNSGVGNTIGAGALGAARGLTLHGSDWLLDHLGLVSYDKQRDLQDAHPIASGVGEFAGAVAPALLTGGATAAESATELGAEGIEAARGVASLAPTNAIARVGTAAREALGGGTLGKAAGGAVDNALYQGVSSLVDGVDGRDPHLSAERWLGQVLQAGALGGGLTLGGVGLGKLAEAGETGLGGVRRMLGLGDAKAVDGMRSFDVRSFEGEPYAPGKAPPDIAPGSRGEAVLEGGSSYKDDLNTLAQTIRQAPGGARPEALESIRLLRDKYVPHMVDGTLPPGAHAAMLEHLANVENTAERLSKDGLGGSLPDRWGQLQRQTRQNSIKDVNLAEGMSDSGRVNANVGAHIDPTNTAGPGPTVRDAITGHLNDRTTSSSALLSRVRDAVVGKVQSTAGRYAKALGLGVIGGEIGGKLAGVTGGVGRALGGAALKLQAMRLAAKGVQRVFADPHLASLAGAGAAQTLQRAVLGDGYDGRSKEQSSTAQRALADYAARARQVSPQMASARVLDGLKSAGVSPQVAFLAAQAAGRRQSAIQASLPAVDPSDAATKVTRFTEEQARSAAEVYKAASHPDYAFHMALQGRLSPTALSTAEDVFPGTISRIRSELIRGVAESGGPGKVPPEILRTVRALDGKDDRGQYGAFVQASIDRSKATPRQTPAPSGPSGAGPSGSPYASTADKVGSI